MLSTFDVLSSIYKDWNKMNEAEQSSLALTLGMKTQIDVLGATLNNFDSALKAVDVSMNSQGSAMRENEAYMQSLEAKTTLLKSQFQELVLGDGGLSSFIKLIVDSGTAILKFANSDIGKAIIQITLMTTALTLANKGLTALGNTKLAKLISEVSLLKRGVQSVTTSTLAMDIASKGLTKTIISLGKAWLLSPIGMTTATVGGVYVLVTALNKLSKTTKDLQEQSIKSTEEYKEQSGIVENLANQIKELDDQIGKINKKDKLTVTDKEQLTLLERQKGVLEAQAYLEQIKLDRKKEQAKLDSEKVLSSVTSDLVPVFDEGGNYFGYGAAQLTQIETLEAYSKAISNTTEELDNLIQKQKEQPKDSKEYKQSAKAIAEKKQEITDLMSQSEKYSSIVSKELSNLDKNSKLYNESTKALENNASAIKGTTKNLEDKINVDENDIDNTEVLVESQEEYLKVISGLASAYQLASDAQYEYNQQGYLSIDTYSDLMNMKPEYLAMMFDENGQLVANTEATASLVQAQIQQLGIESALAQIDLASSMLEKGESYAALTQQVANNTSANWDLVNSELVVLKLKAERGEISWKEYQAIYNTTEAIREQTNAAMANVKVNISSYQPTNRNTDAQNKNTSARKANADATKAQTNALKQQKQALEAEADALEKQLDDYEIVIDYVKDLLKEEQEALEEQKDKELQAIQDKIDALEKEQDAFNENVDSKLEALEKQRDETEKFYDDQIDAINKENEAIQENLKLKELQEKLARAKTQKVKVFKDGQFVYAQDEEAISKAEQELADYEAQLAVQRQIEELERLKEEALQSLDKQIEELKQYREETNKNYDQQLEDLKNHYDKVEAEYDKRIKQYDDYLKKFEKMLNASAKKHAEILYKELVGEQKNWDDRMKALQKFVNNYDAKKAQLDRVKNEINSITNQIQGLENQARSIQGNINGIVSNANGQLGNLKGIYNEMNAMEAKLRWTWKIVDKNGKAVADGSDYVNRWEAQEKGDYYKKQLDPFDQLGYKLSVYKHDPNVKKYAKGSYGISDDQIALVADPKSPQNRELVIGSKINQDDGILGKFKKGTGVIPAGQTLTENLVNLARWSQNGGLERVVSNTNNSSSNIIQIDNINLPSVQNGEDFVEYLQNNFMNDSIQFSNTRL